MITTTTLRDSFWERVYELAQENRNINIVTADMGAPALDKFKRDLSSQFIDVGIAEQQAIAVAAGLSLGGKKVFAYAIAPFITLRCYEHIRVELAAMNIPVTLVGVGAGFSYDDSGPTHHTLEDISALRIFPHIRIHNITDSVMASAFAEISCKADYPNYVRLDRHKLPVIYTSGSDFSSGINMLRKGQDITILATGNMVHRAIEVADKLKKNAIAAGIIDVYTFPINVERLLDMVSKSKKLVTLEEHTLPGGLGSAVCEILMDHCCYIPLRRLGLNLREGYCYKYGGRSNIQSLYKLDTLAVSKSISEFLKEK
jgi:transketolase